MRGCFLSTASVLLVLAAAHSVSLAQEKDFNAYPDQVAAYLKRLYDPSQRPLAFRADYPGGLAAWQHDARAALRLKLRMDKIAASVGDHRPRVTLEEPKDLGDYTRQRGVIETEPDVRIPFWLLKPKSIAEDRNVAVQAVKLGFVAIAPAVRGLSAAGVPDLYDRHGGRDCRSHAMHCLVAGRTATGERVWDMQRILNWALALPEVDPDRVLMMGNSGGGMVTIFTAACDQRIGVAVPSCSFAPTVSEGGYIFHCDCNVVPGLIELGGLPGVAGLIAPRRLLAVNGRKDTLFSEQAVEEAAAAVRDVYQAAGCPERFAHRWGPEGHRFYKDLMWPFVLAAMQPNEAQAAP